MLAEFLADRGDWAQVMPGARACLFSLEEGTFPLPLQLAPLHFETLFCLRGAVTLTRRDGSSLTAGARQVLSLTDLSNLTGASVDAPLEGILVAVDARGARESLETICNLLGGLILDTSRVRRWMTSRGGCAVEGPTHWSRAAFADLERLPQSERALSRRACLSATTVKEGFRRLYGLPVHTWLRQRRMERAAELLHTTELSLEGVAKAVGYSSVSQFIAAFRQQYGLTPGQYRKNV